VVARRGATGSCRLFIRNPRLKPWAIVGRPHGTLESVFVRETRQTATGWPNSNGGYGPPRINCGPTRRCDRLNTPPRFSAWFSSGSPTMPSPRLRPNSS